MLVVEEELGGVEVFPDCEFVTGGRVGTKVVPQPSVGGGEGGERG